MANNVRREVTGWVGWSYFAGLLLVTGGVFQMISGLTALLNDTYYVVTKEGLVVLDFTFWGWAHLVLGVLAMVVGTAVVSGQLWGRLAGVALAMLSLVVSFTFVVAYPTWAVINMVLSVLVIYALTVRVDEA